MNPIIRAWVLIALISTIASRAAAQVGFRIPTVPLLDSRPTPPLIDSSLRRALRFHDSTTPSTGTRPAVIVRKVVVVERCPMPVFAPDSTSQDRMPVTHPDTTSVDRMPVAKTGCDNPLRTSGRP